MIAAYEFHFAQPMWLIASAVVIPMVWIARRSLSALRPLRRWSAVGLRVVGVLVLAAVLAHPTITATSDALTLIVVMDRSQSIPASAAQAGERNAPPGRPPETRSADLQQAAVAYLAKAAGSKRPKDSLAVVDVAETALIARLPSVAAEIPARNASLNGRQTNLADGVQLAMAVAPPDAAVRIILVSDGNENMGDLKEAARIAAANGIPIDVLPLRYRYGREVVFRRLVAPVRARSGQTVTLRFVLHSTAPAAGRLQVNLNRRPLRLDSNSALAPATGPADLSMPIVLKPGTNVETVSVPVGAGGVHEFEAFFTPTDPNQDRLTENNQASAVTFVAGPGHVLVVDSAPAVEEGKPPGGAVAARCGEALADALARAGIEVRRIDAGDFPMRLADLLSADAVVLVNTDNSRFTHQQQEMLCRYVTELGGGLVMVGGPEAFGAGGWIGSPVAQILPVDLDPPAKKVMPKGALVLILHACEMPQGNYWGKQVALAAVGALSRLDLAGVLSYQWDEKAGHWVRPLSEVGDKKAVTAKINAMQMGDMPDFGPHLQEAYDALVKCGAVAKHVIIISDGDPAPPGKDLLNSLRKAGITVSGVTVFPHSASVASNLEQIAAATGGRHYAPRNPDELPQIFIKEAKVVRRPLIIEEPFAPKVTDPLSETVRGLLGGAPDAPAALPRLDGIVLTGPKGGLTQLVLATPQGDPVLATAQVGLGRVVAFTSSVDARWASNWLRWGGYGRFWEQTVRWVGKSSQPADCEVYADPQGRDVSVSVEAAGTEGRSSALADLAGQVIAPDMTARPLPLAQAGPGQYRGSFRADQAGSFLINVRYKKAGEAGAVQAQGVVNVPYAPEFEDITDNAALLAEAAGITGGRILALDPNQAEGASGAGLFDRGSLRFPQASMPIAQPLLLAWLGLFLLDVAVRRIAVDFRAMGRRAASAAAWLWERTAGRLLRRGAAGATLERLRIRRRQVAEQLAPRPAPDAGAESQAGRRYEGAEPASGPLPVEKGAEPQTEQPAKPSLPACPPAEGRRAAGRQAQAPAEPPAKAQEQPKSHLDRLLAAKRKARQKPSGEDKDTTGGKAGDKKEPGEP